MRDISNLERQYLKAKIAYYSGTPIMSDAAFDVVERELKAVGSKVVEQVGAKRKDFDFPHPTQMRSLAKIQTESINGVTNYMENAFMDWVNKCFSTAFIFKSTKVGYSAKFDGNAINIIFRQNRFESVLTRGDGKSGKDITDRLGSFMPKVLDCFPFPTYTMEIRCEAVIRLKTFNSKYAATFANARNYVAGVLGADEFDLNRIAELSLVPVHFIVDGKHKDISLLEEMISNYPIFASSNHATFLPSKQSYIDVVKSMEKMRETCDFQLNGIVFDFPCDYREILGENEHDPEWSLAVKFIPEECVTTVSHIDWSLGKTGELTPVVNVKPVPLAGTIVKRASGYNAGYVIKNKLGEGAIVSLAKAGDIIPEIQSIIAQGDDPTLPKTCPACGETLTYDGIHLMCNNTKCTGIIARKLGSAASMLDLKGIAGKTLEPFASKFDDMYKLFVWVRSWGDSPSLIEEYGIKYHSRSHEIFLNAFNNVKSLTYAQVILMMGYDRVGNKLAEQVAREYCGLIPDYKGHEKALVDEFKNADRESYIKSAVRVLESLGVIVEKPKDDMNNDITYIVMTGSPSPFNKTKAEFISRFSNVKETSLNDPKCKYLITDSYTSSSGKMNVAKKKGISIKTYEDFIIESNSFAK
jgi:DNA ligase (NAD+)